MPDSKRGWSIIAREVFQVSLVTYLILLILESIKSGFVGNFVNINYLLPVILISGIAMTVLADSEQVSEQPKRIGEFDIYYIVAMSVGAGMLVYYKTSELGTISVVISVICSIVIILLSLLVFTDT